MAQEWESETLIIKEVEERTGRTSGNVFWVVKTDKGEYTLFEAPIFDKVAANIGNKCELKTFRDDTHANIKGFVKIVKAGKTEAAPASSSGAKRFGANIEMLVSYAKDLVVAGKVDSMELGIAAVIAAYTKASSEL